MLCCVVLYYVVLCVVLCCIITCFFFPLICLACFPSSATASTFPRRVWPQTPRGSLAPLGTLGSPGSPGSYVCPHMLFVSPHLPGLLPIVCDGQHRPMPAMATFRPKATFLKLGEYVGGYFFKFNSVMACMNHITSYLMIWRYCSLSIGQTLYGPSTSKPKVHLKAENGTV